MRSAVKGYFMRFIADFHLHSKYSRATSKDMEVETLARWAKKKGISLLGTGDFTHPTYLRNCNQNWFLRQRPISVEERR